MRYLKWLVTTLTVTMIVGLVVLIALVVMRFNQSTPLEFPDQIALPQGVNVESLTRGPDYLLVVSEDGRAFVFSPDGQTLRKELDLD